MRWLMKRQLEYGKEVHICFIDYSKAFDCINHELLWKTFLEMGIPKHLIQLLKGLYEDQSAVKRTELGDTDRFKTKKGVRQGCIHGRPQGGARGSNCSPWILSIFYQIEIF